MVKRRTSANENIRELQRKLSKALHNNNEQLASDVYIELGDEYRRMGDLQSAIKVYVDGAQLAQRITAFENAAFAYRAIAEISVDPGIAENKSALEHGRKYLEAANKTQQVHLIQLAYHVLGWLYLQVYLNSTAKHTSLLEKGKRWCEKCLSYLEKNAAEIDSDQRAIRMGRDTACRRARVRQVLSQIYDKLGMVQMARYHHNAVIAYASRTADHDLQYRCLLAKLDFAGGQRLKTAIELVQVASNLSSRELVEAQLILAEEKARVKDFEGAKWDLISMLSSKAFKKFTVEEQKSFQQLLIIVYKTVERLKEVNELDEHQQARVYEKIADEFCEIELREVSLDFYKLMLKCATSVPERIAALVSVAVTAKELGRYEEAYERFVEVETLESQRSISDLKRAETAICVACSACNVRTLSNSSILKLLEKAESYAITNAQKCDLYEAMLEFLHRSNGEASLVKDTEEKLARTKLVINKEGATKEGDLLSGDDSDDEARSSFSDRWDEMNDMEIIDRCMAESSQRSADERIKREKDKRINSYGETRLHEAARGDDISYLKALIAADYNVNVRDEGGWTPLHEAIGAQKIENLRLLLKAGAKTDIRSREGTLSADGQCTDSGGLTPLMEACDRGSTAMIGILLQFGANVALKNRDNWTAVDFLRNAITAGMVEDEDISEAERFIRLMEDKLRQANVPAYNVPPPKKLAIKEETKSRTQERKQQSSNGEQLSPEKLNLREYRRTMCNLGRGDVHDHGTVDEVIYPRNVYSSESNDTAYQVASIDEGLDALLYGSEESENCGKLVLKAAPPEGMVNNRLSAKRCTSFGISAQPNMNYSDSGFIEDDIGRTRRPGISRNRKRQSSPIAIRSSASKMPYHRVIELPESSDSDEEISVVSTRSAGHTNSLDSRDVSLMPSTIDRKTNEQRSDPMRLIGSNSQVVAAQALQHLAHSTSYTSMIQQHTTVASRLLFVKVIFMTEDGVRLKTKGIPFPSTSRIHDVKARCRCEIAAEGEFQSLILYDGECELDDETPLELVADSNKQVECKVLGWMPPSAAHIYSSKSTHVMSNVLGALSDVLDGCLRLSEANIGEDTALTAAMRAFVPNSLSAIRIDGNELSSELIEVIAKMAANLTELSMGCCRLNSKSVHLLLESKGCPQLTFLDMSFNDLSTSNSSDSIAALVRVCPNLSTLHLACCNLGHSTASQLVYAITESCHLKELDLSQNVSINAEHVTQILDSCSELRRLNIAATGVTEINGKVNVVSKLCDVNLSLCELCDDAEALFGWLLKCCDGMVTVDLQATNINLVQLEAYCKQKATRPPVTTMKLAGCTKIESDVEIFTSMLKVVVTTNFAIKFDLEEEFRNKVVAALPDSFAFCIT